MKDAGYFAEMPIPNFLDIIQEGGARADEAMYFLLHQRLLGRLRNRYEIYQRQLQDDFDDVLADFFLYLRDGKEGRNTVTYLSLRSIKSKDAFETWMLNTFRNYISVTANTKPPLTIVTTNLESESKIQNPDVSCSPLTDERKLAVASTLIAYAHQTSLPRDRFILLRSRNSVHAYCRAKPFRLMTITFRWLKTSTTTSPICTPYFTPTTAKRLMPSPALPPSNGCVKNTSMPLVAHSTRQDLTIPCRQA